MEYDPLSRLIYYEDIYNTRNSEDAVGPGVDACESETSDEDDKRTSSTPGAFRSTIASRAKAAQEAASSALSQAKATLETSGEGNGQIGTPKPAEYKALLERQYRISPSVNGQRSIPVDSAIGSPSSSTKKIRLTPRFGMFGRYQESPTRRKSYQDSCNGIQESIEPVNAETGLKDAPGASDEYISQENMNEAIAESPRCQRSRGISTTQASPSSITQLVRPSTKARSGRPVTREELPAAASQAGYRGTTRPKRGAVTTASDGNATLDKQTTIANPNTAPENVSGRLLRSRIAAHGHANGLAKPSESFQDGRVGDRSTADGSAKEDESGRGVLVNWKGRRIVLPSGGGYVVTEKAADVSDINDG